MLKSCRASFVRLKRIFSLEKMANLLLSGQRCTFCLLCRFFTLFTIAACSRNIRIFLLLYLKPDFWIVPYFLRINQSDPLVPFNFFLVIILITPRRSRLHILLKVVTTSTETIGAGRNHFQCFF